MYKVFSVLVYLWFCVCSWIGSSFSVRIFSFFPRTCMKSYSVLNVDTAFLMTNKIFIHLSNTCQPQVAYEALLYV